MAFGNVGNFFLKYNQSVGVSISFGGQDRGAQYIAAHPLNSQGQLVLSGQSKLLNNDGSFTYLCAVLNHGPVGPGNPGEGTTFTLQGGGFV
jgi:hypothetical protein